MLLDEVMKYWPPIKISLYIFYLNLVDGYFELACSPAVKLGGRNKEYAHHILHKLGGSVKVFYFY